jgi:glycosyltransferase involved in cell wall biosynthesis
VGKRLLMLVSQRADEQLRADVAAGRRPEPEYLRLESTLGVELLDWSRLGGSSRRHPAVSLRQALAGLRRAPSSDVIFSDGEHVGIPLALALRAARLPTPHVMLGHRLSAPSKRPFFTRLHADRGMTRILVHSRRQLEIASRELGIDERRLAFVPYFADTAFWHPFELPEEPLIVAAGREHRDYQTLALACQIPGVRTFVAAGSLHSPGARSSRPAAWPSGFEARFAGYEELRLLYARAAVVVVPLLETDFQAGITSLLEAMAMGKAVIVSAANGHADIVLDGETGILVPPGDPRRLRIEIERLLARPELRARLGRQARKAVERQYSLETYVESLRQEMVSAQESKALIGSDARAHVRGS